MKRKQPTPLTIALGSAMAATLAGVPAAAADNPFSARSLGSGYMVAAADKAVQGQCGEGKCGAAMGMKPPTRTGAAAQAAPKAKAKIKPNAVEGKCGEGKCGEGKCGSQVKPASASAPAAKAVEGKCGAKTK